MSFTDLYLRAESQEVLEAGLSGAGIPIAGQGVWVDRIGSLQRLVGYEEGGEPIFATFDEYHMNLRLAEAPTAEQLEAVQAFLIAPPDAPFRVWA